MNTLITITTDFGDQFASAQLKAVIASLDFNGQIIENHSVSPFSIVEGAFEIGLLAYYSPKNSVHIGVVDPSVGSTRQGIIIKTKKSWFVGPDNGLLYQAAIQEHIINVWKIEESKISSKFSNTFHGRDIFIKVAVFIAKGKSVDTFVHSKINPKTLVTSYFKPGQVLHIDYYGNIKIYWKEPIKFGEKLIIKANKKSFTIPIVKTFADVAPGTPLAYMGSSNILEIAVNLGRADKHFKFKIGQLLHVSRT